MNIADMTISFMWFWLAAGLAFWADCLRYSGFPGRWKSVGQYIGRAEMLFFWLPVMMLGGAAWWVVLAYYHWRR